jgi:large subunit ribosomal protein L7/L12
VAYSRTLPPLTLVVESAPKVVKEAVALEAAEDINQQLEAVGAKVSLK